MFLLWKKKNLLVSKFFIVVALLYLHHYVAPSHGFLSNIPSHRGRIQKHQTFNSFLPKISKYENIENNIVIHTKINQPPQLLTFREPKTNTKVILVGTMHYNPTSIKMVQQTIQSLGEKDELGSVVVESCDVRWNTTMEILKTSRGKILEPFLTSEMKVACDEALKYNRPCVLGDQRIDITGTSLKRTLEDTFVDIASPFNGGWERIYRCLTEAAAVALPSGEGLKVTSILDPRLLIAAPVSFAKYPFSFLARNPISTSIFFTIIYFLTTLDSGSTAFVDASLEEQVSSIIISTLFAVVEITFFGRLFIEVLLAERNEILARNILDQCKKYSKSNKNKNVNILSILNVFNQKVKEKAEGLDSETTIYVPGLKNYDNNWFDENDDKERTVVAVVGMAHCNGILKLLKEELV